MKKCLFIALILMLFSYNTYAATVIEETTAAATGTLFLVEGKVPATCHVSGTISTTALGEEITIQSRDIDNTTWQSIVEGGVTKILDSENTILAIYAPGTYRFSKSTTAAAAGLICTY